MKLKYIKAGKLNYQGNQYRTGEIIEVDSLGNLPENWFEVIEESEPIEEIIEEKKTKKITRPKIEKTKEVFEDGNKKSTNEDLGG